MGTGTRLPSVVRRLSTVVSREPVPVFRCRGEFDRRATPEIGLVGPMSNYATPPQLVEEVPYRDLGQMHAFARRWRDEHRGKWFNVAKLSGFCVLMTRAVVRRRRRPGRAVRPGALRRR